MPDEESKDPDAKENFQRWIEEKKKPRGGYLLAGVLALTPITVTGFIIYFLFAILAGVGRPIADWMATQLTPYVPRLANFITNDWFLRFTAVIFVIAIIYMIGWLAKNVLGSQLIALFELFLERIPLVKTVYGAVKKLVIVLQENPGGDVKRVVLIEFPSPEMKTVGLVTRTFTDHYTGEELVAVYVPTTPNPTSGFVIMVPRRDVRVLDMEIDEALKMIISLGVVVPTWKKDQTGELPFAEPDKPS